MILKMANWNKKFIELSKHIATWSKDSTKVGTVIINNDNRIVSVGYNGFPSGCNDDIPERHERPLKYSYSEHAERNAIYNASRIGVSTKDCIIYISTMFPCDDCARAIIQSGIRKLVCYKPDFNDVRWGEKFKISYEMLTEVGIEIIYYED
jgi:dCMP deaminase